MATPTASPQATVSTIVTMFQSGLTPARIADALNTQLQDSSPSSDRYTPSRVIAIILRELGPDAIPSQPNLPQPTDDHYTRQAIIAAYLADEAPATTCKKFGVTPIAYWAILEEENVSKPMQVTRLASLATVRIQKEVIQRYNAGHTMRRISKELGITDRTVSAIIRLSGTPLHRDTGSPNNRRVTGARNVKEALRGETVPPVEPQPPLPDPDSVVE